MKSFPTRRLFAVLLVLTMVTILWKIPSKTVYAASKLVKSITLKIGSEKVTKKTFKITKGEIKKLKVSVKPVSSKKSVVYQSKNPKVLTISDKGKLQSKNVGVAKIIVKVKDKKGKSRQTWVKIKVNKKKKISTSDNNVNADNTHISDLPEIPDSPSEIEKPEPENNNITNYTVTFNLNYESAGIYKTISVAQGQKVAKPEDPICNNSMHTFAYWSINPTGGEQFDFDIAITSNIILYAQWSEFKLGLPGPDFSSGSDSTALVNKNWTQIFKFFTDSSFF